MDAGTVVLLHSPLVRAATWGRLPERLRDQGLAVVVVDVTRDDRPPFATRYVADAAQQVRLAGAEPPVVLVAHSGAGPLLPQVGYAQRAARRAVGAYVFLDAGLPRPNASRLDLLHETDESTAHAVRDQLLAGGLVPDWDAAGLAATGLDPSGCEVVLGSVRPRGLDYYREHLPYPGDWPDAPCAYVRTSEAYRPLAERAARRGFVVAEAGGGHFAALVDPDGLARVLADLITDL